MAGRRIEQLSAGLRLREHIIGAARGLALGANESDLVLAGELQQQRLDLIA